MFRFSVLIALFSLSCSTFATIECPNNTQLKGYEPPKGLEQRCESASGKLHGPFKRWYGNGQLMQLLHYQNGKEHGQQEGWWPDGKPMMKGVSVNGKRYKGFQYWDMSGKEVDVQFQPSQNE